MLPTFYGSRFALSDDHIPTVGGGSLDEVSRVAGPGMALLADASGVRGVCRYDHEHGADLNDVELGGWVS
jgi:hypothetical protein